MTNEPQTGGEMVVEWPTIDLATLDWWPIATYSREAGWTVIVQDVDNKTWLAAQDDGGVWREFIDNQLTRKLVPIRWAIPTDDMVQALAFG